MNIYIDESGNLGKKDRYFVIALIVPHHPKRIKNIIKTHCAKHELEELKASQTSFRKKQTLLNKFCKHSDHDIAYIVLDKKNLTSDKLWKDKNLLFNYIFGHLVKQFIKNISEDIHITLDEHTTKVTSRDALKDYVRTSAYGYWGFKNNISMTLIDSRRNLHVQAADLIANAVFAHYNYGRTHLYNLLNVKHSIQFPYKTFGQ